MSDVIFSLLLFFVLTQSFLTVVPLDLPAAASGSVLDGERPLTVEITSSATVRLRGTELSGHHWGDTLSRMLAEIPASTPVLISAHKAAPVGVAVEVLDRLRLRGISQAGLLTVGTAMPAGAAGGAPLPGQGQERPE